MTTNTYAESEKRSPRGEEDGSDSDSDYPNRLPNPEADKENISSRKRRGRTRAAFEGSNGSSTTIELNGKLARQLRKGLETQLAEYTSWREKALERAATYEKKILELQEDLEDLKQIIEQLIQIEEEIEESEVFQE